MRVRDPEALRDQIYERRFTQRELAAACGLASHGMISYLVTGKVKTCSKELATKLEKILGCEPGDLFVSNKSARRSTLSNGQPTTDHRRAS